MTDNTRFREEQTFFSVTKPVVSYDKLRNAPSTNTAFPANANLTAVEITTFFPRWLRTWDVIDRFVSNGATTMLLSDVIVCFIPSPLFQVYTHLSTCTDAISRDMKEANTRTLQNKHRQRCGSNIAANSILKAMQHSLRKREPVSHYGAWTLRQHITSPNFDHNNLSVKGFRTIAETHQDSHIYEKDPFRGPFRELANHVVIFPSGYDALDLTRCVQHAKDHPNETWIFPDDYDTLIQYVGGPKPVTIEHCDQASFLRWARKTQITRIASHNLPDIWASTSNVTPFPATSPHFVKEKSGATCYSDTTSPDRDPSSPSSSELSDVPSNISSSHSPSPELPPAEQRFPVHGMFEGFVDRQGRLVEATLTPNTPFQLADANNVLPQHTTAPAQMPKDSHNQPARGFQPTNDPTLPTPPHTTVTSATNAGGPVTNDENRNLQRANSRSPSSSNNSGGNPAGSATNTQVNRLASDDKSRPNTTRVLSRAEQKYKIGTYDPLSREESRGKTNWKVVHSRDAAGMAAEDDYRAYIKYGAAGLYMDVNDDNDDDDDNDDEYENEEEDEDDEENDEENDEEDEF